MWWLAWPGYGGAVPLHAYAYADLVKFAPHESAFFLSLLVLQPLLFIALTLRFGGRIGVFLSARRAELLERPVRTLFALALVAALVALALALAAGHLHLMSEDEKTYLFQARLLLHGRLWMPVPPDPYAFYQPFVVRAGNHWSGQYPWAQPALLALGELVHFPHAIPPLEVAVTVFFSGLCAREFTGDDRIGVATSVLVASSPLVLMTGATLHNANLSGACAAMMLWGTARLANGPSWRASAALGLALGVASHNRPLDALVLALGLAGLLLWARRHELPQTIVRFAPPLLFALPLLALHPWLNYLVSGNIWHNGYWLFNRGHGWITMGFGQGPFNDLHTPSVAAAKMFPIALRLGFFSTGSPVILLALLPWLGVARVPRRQVVVPVTLTLAYLAAYFFYASTCIDTTGPIYYVALLPVIACALACGLVALRDAASSELSRFVPGALVCVLGVALVTFWPSELLDLSRAADQAGMCQTVVAKEKIHRALVFVRAPTRQIPTWAQWPPFPHPDLQDPVLFARAASPDKDAQVVRDYARGRPVYMASCIGVARSGLISYDPQTATIGTRKITPEDRKVLYPDPNAVLKQPPDAWEFNLGQF